MERIQIRHTIPPIYDENSELLILGSFPSVKSRASAFFYGHPRNRFWQVLAEIYGETLPKSVDEKKAMLLREHIALWDVIASCSIVGSDDSSIRDVAVNDLRPILETSGLKRIYVNGKTAHRLYQQFMEPELGIPAVMLPSTSPANAAWKTEALVRSWCRIRFPFGESVTVTVDRPLGSRHPQWPDMLYPVNYGYVEGVRGGDGGRQDAYILGLDKPVGSFTGKLVAVVHRLNDPEDKWVVMPEGMDCTDDEILDKLHFREHFFQTELWR